MIISMKKMLYIITHIPCRKTSFCLNLAAEQERTVTEKWLPELKTAILNAQKCLEDCNYVRGLVSDYRKLNYLSLHCLSTCMHVSVRGVNLSSFT